MADCPPPQRLEQLLAEQLDDAARAALETHIETCLDCQRTLHNLTADADPGTTLLLTGDPTARAAETVETEAFFDRLKGLNPSTPPASVDHLQIPGYDVLDELGRGANAVVYRARHQALNRFVALKVILAGRHLTPDARQRFSAEARVIARLKHRNIVQVYDVGAHDDCPFLSLELIDGGTLADWLHGKPRSAIESARIVRVLATAIEFAHHHGVIHRDLKPSNVLLSVLPDQPTRSELKITDFGIAKVLPQAGIAEARMTHTGEILGTPAYMAPEQARGQTLSPATDIYSLGAILYELLTGRPPFQGSTALDTLLQATRQEPVSVRILVPRVPLDLETICLKCLEKDPARRYATAAALAADLDHFLNHKPISARPISWFGHLIRWARRRPALAAALTGIAVLLIGLCIALGRAATSSQKLAQEKAAENTTAQNTADHEALLRHQAEDANVKLRSTLYVNQMNLGGRAAMAPGGIGRVGDALERWRTDLPDLRGWEWYYLDGLCHRDLFTLSVQPLCIETAAWTPDNHWIATGQNDGSVVVWDAFARHLGLRFQAHTDRVHAVAINPIDDRLATASWDGTVKIWDIVKNKLLVTFHGHPDGAFGLAWSPDGQRIASGGKEKTIQIWDPNTGGVQQTLRGHTDVVLGLAWTADGKRLASSSADRDVRVWDTTTGACLHILHRHINIVRRVAWSPDGSKLASAGNDNSAIIWDPATGAVLRTLSHAMGVSDVVWSPDGTQLATASEDQTIKIWNLNDDAEPITLRGHLGEVNTLAWSTDGTRLASGSNDGTLKVWSATTGREVPSLPGHNAGIHGLCWSPDNRRIASAGGDRNIRIWDPITQKNLLTLSGHTDWVLAVAWSPDGQTLASAGNDGTIRLWNPWTGQLLRVINASTEAITTLAWSPDGQTLASGNVDKLVHLWNPADGTERRRLVGHTSYVFSVAFSPDGHHLASGSGDASARIWNPSTGAIEAHLTGHLSGIQSVAWSPDGKSLATASSDQTIKLWDAATGNLTATLRGHTARLSTLAWSPDGQRLASGGDDSTLKIWNPVTATETLSLDEPGNPIKSVSWSPDSLTLAVGGDSGNVLLYDASAGYLASESPHGLPALDRRLNDHPTFQDWHHRAVIDAGRVDWTEATTDLQHEIALDPKHAPFFPFGFWVVGPYPEDLNQPFGPESDTDFGHLAAAEPGKQPDLLPWHYVPLAERGHVDFRDVLKTGDHLSAYALMRVYAPAETHAAMLLGADDDIRIWLNGTSLFRQHNAQAAQPDATAIPVTLTAGWNTILSRVSNVVGAHELYLRLSTTPADLKRADDSTQ
jgi:WD40 repeat protein/tRNA A-37 threonylcarbamoyl transferase component Bud32